MIFLATSCIPTPRTHQFFFGLECPRFSPMKESGEYQCLHLSYFGAPSFQQTVSFDRASVANISLRRLFSAEPSSFPDTEPRCLETRQQVWHSSVTTIFVLSLLIDRPSFSRFLSFLISSSFISASHSTQSVVSSANIILLIRGACKPLLKPSKLSPRTYSL